MTPLLFLLSADPALGSEILPQRCALPWIAGQPVPPNANLLFPREAGSLYVDLIPLPVVLTDGQARVVARLESHPSPGAWEYWRVVPLSTPLAPGVWSLATIHDPPVKEWERAEVEFRVEGEPDVTPPTFGGVAVPRAGWWPASRGVALMVTLTGLADPSPLAVEVHLSLDRERGRGPLLDHNVDDEALAGSGAWWDLIAIGELPGPNVHVELFGGRCARGLPAGTRVGDRYRVTLTVVDIAGNAAASHGFQFEVPP